MGYRVTTSANLIILFVLATIVITLEVRNTKQVTDRFSFYFMSDNHERNLVAHYWSKILCHMRERHTIVFLDGYFSVEAHSTQDFFNKFTNHLYNTQLECINAISINSYDIQHLSSINDANLSWLSESSRCFTSSDLITQSPAHEKSFFFNNPLKARVIISSIESIDLLIRYEYVLWDRSEYVVLLIILENNHEMINNCNNKSMNKMISKILIHIFEILWNKNGAHNVFIGFPLLTLHKPKFWTYDPFHQNNNSQHSGKIIESDPMTSPIFKRLQNLHGYKMNIGLFESKLTAEIRADKYHTKNYYHCQYSPLVIEDFHGVDGYLAQTMSNYLNFSVNIIPPSAQIKYGYVNNGTPVGTLGDVAYHRIHASFNSQYVKKYIAGNQKFKTSLDVEFTVPVDWDRVCIIVPSSEEIPRWLRTFFYFHPAIWLCLLVAVILATIVWHLFRNYHHSASNDYSKYDKNYLAVFIDTFMLLVGAPMRTIKVSGERILIGGLALLGLTIMGAFTGTLYHSFTNEIFYRPIETLEELDASGLTIATSSPNLGDIFGPNNHPEKSSTLSRLANKIKNVENDNISTIEKTAFRRNVAAIYREDVFLIEQHRYVNFKGRSLVHLVPDCPQSYYLAYLMPANSIFLDRFNYIITALREAGIIHFWNDNTIQHSINSKIVSAKSRKDQTLEDPKPFSVHDMQTCFLVLAIGLVVSFIVFIIEWMNIISIKYGIQLKCRNSSSS
ncbi:hypothetical protein PV328_002396 [Microctonus aethiopoides]|uniref:Ionotropic glutamate receptor C-terminal domain-containing protein n=1 Tax=Microctonus aethiopoides TaxID=144406 RepID=A0AA39KYC6_9HYME|nr:hypothetical protein PV328_002396 [Microctonus aethiopoides]